MELGKQIEPKPVNYGRGGEGWVDRTADTMEALKKGKEQQPVAEEYVDLAGQLKAEVEAEAGDLSPEKIQAVIRNIQSQVEMILAKKSLYEQQGMKGDEVESLLAVETKQILDEIGVDEKMYVIDEVYDDIDMRKNRVALKDAVDNFIEAGKMKK